MTYVFCTSCSLSCAWAICLIVVRICLVCSEDESGDKLVSVQLDDEESWLNFIDVPGSEVSSLHALYKGWSKK